MVCRTLSRRAHTLYALKAQVSKAFNVMFRESLIPVDKGLPVNSSSLKVCAQSV